jgi:hypothetical protein
MQHEGFPPRSLLTPTTHRLSFPTCLSHPRNIHLHCSTVHRLLHFPSRASTTGQIRNSQSSVAVVGLPPGEITSPTISLTWREFLTGLTTCFFNHGPDNPPLQTTGLTTYFFVHLLSQPGNHSSKIG